MLNPERELFLDDDNLDILHSSFMFLVEALMALFIERVYLRCIELISK